MVVLLHQMPSNEFTWTLDGDGPPVVNDKLLNMAADVAKMLAIGHVPVGNYELTVESATDPLVNASAPVVIGSCPHSPPPEDPTDPVVSTDPQDSTVPSTTTTARPSDAAAASTGSGTLPETGLSSTLPATR